MNREPTYLMVKQHSVSGLKYLCKTIRKDPYQYKGSGVKWTQHIKEFGTQYVETIWCELFDDIDKLTEFALFLSQEADIVNSDQWANLINEDGLTGFESINSSNIQKRRIEDGTHHLLSGIIQKEHQNSRVEDGTHNWLSGEEQRLNQSRLISEGKHRFCNSEYQSRVSITGHKKRMENGTHCSLQQHTCPHCGKIGKGVVMFRHHFDRCKYVQ